MTANPLPLPPHLREEIAKALHDDWHKGARSWSECCTKRPCEANDFRIQALTVWSVLSPHVGKLAWLIRNLLENDPDDPISDAGHTVLDLWRHDAKAALRLFTQTAPAEQPNTKETPQCG